MKWINFLHLYQPPTQTKEILDVVVKESYLLILDLLEKFPGLKLTINFSGSLLELLEKNGYEDVIKSFAYFANKKRIEFVGSAMYHPILPLIPDAEIFREIELSNAICKKWFGENYNPKGFYFPEMAYSDRAAKIVKQCGFEWIILDEIQAIQPNQKSSTGIDSKVKYLIENVDLEVIFRNNKISKTFPPEFVAENFESIKNTNLVTAHDGELYGHWHKNDNGYYKRAFGELGIEFVTASGYIDSLQTKEKIAIVDSNWESLPDELESKTSYALWHNPKNIIQSELWSLVDLALATVKSNKEDPNFTEAEIHLHKGLASCAWWWASERKIGPFSPVSWNPTEIEKGAKELLSSILSLRNAEPARKTEAEKLFGKIRDIVWGKHWSQYHKP